MMMMIMRTIIIIIIKVMIIKTIPLFPTPGAPRITSLTSDKDDFFLRTCLIPRIPLLEFILQLFTLSYKMLPQYLADFL